jgi:hypothetical protein
VPRQYTGSAGKVTNCQIGVFATYVSRHGHAFIDRALYFPKSWTDDPTRLKATYVPSTVAFATKPQLAAAMIARAPLPTQFPSDGWLATRSMVSAISSGDLRRAGKGYVLGVDASHVFRSWGKPRVIAGTAAAITEALTASVWVRLAAGRGTNGPRLHEWCYMELADLDAEEFNDEHRGLWTRGLLIRRHIADGDLAYFSTWCPAETTIETLVSVEGHRWAIEDSFETAKNEFGARPQRDQILARLASPRLPRHARLRNDGCHSASSEQADAQKNHPLRLIRWSIQEIRRIAHRLARKRRDPRLHHCMVVEAARPPSPRTNVAYQTEITTVMLTRSGSAGRGVVTRVRVHRARLGPQRTVLWVTVLKGEVKYGLELLLPPTGSTSSRASVRSVGQPCPIYVVVVVDVGDPFPDPTLEHHETGFAFLERACRLRSIRATDDEQAG